MAKKKTSARKSGGKKKKAAKGGSNAGVLVALLGIILILAVIVSYYYIREQPNEKTAARPQVEENARQSPKPEQDRSAPESTPSSVEAETTEEARETNPSLPEYEETDSYYFTNSFDFAWPAYDVDELIVEHEGYTLRYDERNEQAVWVAYKLERRNLENARFKRKDNFREDPLVRTSSATPEDYKKSGYDRGHLAPAGDFTWSEKALDHTFYMSNISPQVPQFNQGIWRLLEEQVRDWARENHTLYIVTGPVIKERKERIGKNKVTVPQQYYKAILDINEPGLKAIGFIMNNEPSNQSILEFAVSIDHLEKVTGLDFFPLLPDEMEKKIESQLDKRSW